MSCSKKDIVIKTNITTEVRFPYPLKNEIPIFEFKEEDFGRLDDEDLQHLESRAITVKLKEFPTYSEKEKELFKKAFSSLVLFGDFVLKIEDEHKL